MEYIAKVLRLIWFTYSYKSQNTTREINNPLDYWATENKENWFTDKLQLQIWRISHNRRAGSCPPDPTQENGDGFCICPDGSCLTPLQQIYTGCTSIATDWHDSGFSQKYGYLNHLNSSLLVWAHATWKRLGLKSKVRVRVRIQVRFENKGTGCWRDVMQINLQWI